MVYLDLSEPDHFVLENTFCNSSQDCGDSHSSGSSLRLRIWSDSAAPPSVSIKAAEGQTGNYVFYFCCFFQFGRAFVP